MAHHARSCPRHRPDGALPLWEVILCHPDNQNPTYDLRSILSLWRKDIIVDVLRGGKFKSSCKISTSEAHFPLNDFKSSHAPQDTIWTSPCSLQDPAQSALSLSGQPLPLHRLPEPLGYCGNCPNQSRPSLLAPMHLCTEHCPLVFLESFFASSNTAQT